MKRSILFAALSRGHHREGVLCCTALAFVLILTWEMVHIRLYTIWPATDGVGACR